jgi:hypothetical protein
MTMNRPLKTLAATLVAGCLFGLQAHAADPVESSLAGALIFHASFDGTYDANVPRGDGQIYTAATMARDEVRAGNHRTDVSIAKGAGRHGDALRFTDTSDQVLFYKADAMAYRKEKWEGTVSFWMRLNPDKDLKPGYCDPIQITERAWNDGAFFVDFDKDLPRDFRLGVFSDLAKWNPQSTPWEEVPVSERPMVTVKRPPFASDAWTHVAFAFRNVNATGDAQGSASLYLNGELQGSVERPLVFSWEVEKAAIMIGILYIGDFDDLAIFNRALTADEIRYLRDLPQGVRSIGVASK